MGGMCDSKQSPPEASAGGCPWARVLSGGSSSWGKPPGVRVSCDPQSRLQPGGCFPLTRRLWLGQKLAVQKTYKHAEAMFWNSLIQEKCFSIYLVWVGPNWSDLAAAAEHFKISRVVFLRKTFSYPPHLMIVLITWQEMAEAYQRHQ